jgi:hypothetical protein
MNMQVAASQGLKAINVVRAVQAIFGLLAVAALVTASGIFSYVCLSTRAAGTGLDARALSFAILWPLVALLITSLGAVSLGAGKRGRTVPLFVIGSLAGCVACWFAVLRLASAPGPTVAALFFVFDVAFTLLLWSLSAAG